MTLTIHCTAPQPQLSCCCRILSGTVRGDECVLTGAEGQPLAEQFSACTTESAVCQESQDFEPRQGMASMLSRWYAVRNGDGWPLLAVPTVLVLRCAVDWGRHKPYGSAA